MQFDTWLAYIATVLVIMSTPGPSHLLMLSNSVSNGFARSIATAAGDLTANFFQMAAATLGLVTVIQSSRTAFVVVKFAGVAYLIFLGIKLWMRSANGELESRPASSLKTLYWQGFVTSASNPKAVIFFAALFPQFLDLSKPAWPQFVVLCCTYLTIDGLFLMFYGKTASWMKNKLGSRELINKVSGGLLIGAALLLLTACAPAPIESTPKVRNPNWFNCEKRFECVIIVDDACRIVPLNRAFVGDYLDWSRSLGGTGDVIPCKETNYQPRSASC